MLEMIMKLNIPLYVMTSMGCIGGLGMLATNLTYRRMIRNTQRLQNLKEKWLNLWKSRDRLWHRMNRFVWYPSLLCTFLLVLSVILNSRLEPGEGLPMLYLYIGCSCACDIAASETGTGFFLQRRTCDGFPCRLRGTGTDLGGRNSSSPEDRSRFAGRDRGSDHKEHPSDCGNRKPFQQDAFSGGGRDHEGDHKRIYEGVEVDAGSSENDTRRYRNYGVIYNMMKKSPADTVPGILPEIFCVFV